MLASGSPRRAELLGLLGLDFEVSPAEVDESHHQGEEPHDYVERLARAKALAKAGPGVVVLGADTTVVFAGAILGKPVHPAEAYRMLEALSGDVHTVFTGVAVAAWQDSAPSLRSCVEKTVVRLTPLTSGEIEAYIATGEPLDKAGGYGLQSTGGVFVESVEGSPTNVVGLPLHAAARLLRWAGVRVLGS